MVVVVTHYRIFGRINEDSVWVMLLAQCQIEYHLLHLDFFLFVCMCTYACSMVHIWKSGQLVKINYTSLHMVPGDQTQGLKLGGKGLNLLSYFDSPEITHISS